MRIGEWSHNLCNFNSHFNSNKCNSQTIIMWKYTTKCNPINIFRIKTSNIIHKCSTFIYRVLPAVLLTSPQAINIKVIRIRATFTILVGVKKENWKRIWISCQWISRSSLTNRNHQKSVNRLIKLYRVEECFKTIIKMRNWVKWKSFWKLSLSTMMSS